MTDHEILNFLFQGTTPDHRNHVLQHIRFHTKDVALIEWDPVTVRSDRYVKMYLEMFARGSVRSSTDDPPLATTLHGRLEAMFGRAPNDVPYSDISISRLLLLGLATPFWVVYRILNYKMYRYLDRLNAEMLDLRNLLFHTRLQVADAAKQIEVLSRLVEELDTRDAESQQEGEDRPDQTHRDDHDRRDDRNWGKGRRAS
jgi:hypothetical protein